MAQQTVNLGSGTNAGDGEPLRDGGDKINANFTELYAFDASTTAALALKAPLASPAFTGTPTAPTAAAATNTTQIATTAFVQSAVSAIIGAAPGALDTLDELAAALADDANFAATVTSALGGKQPLDSDLTAIAALSPANDDVMQRKAGAWTNRTVAQLRADLAAPRVLAVSGAASAAVTGTTAETAIVAIPIPANSMGANGQLVVEIYASCTSGGAPGNRDIRVRFGGNTIGTSTEFAVYRGGSTATTIQVHARISNANSASAQKGPALQNSVFGFGVSANAKVTAAYDTTVDQYIVISGDLVDAGDSIVLESYNVILIPGA